MYFSDNKLLAGREVKRGQTLMLLSRAGMVDDNMTVRFIEAKNDLEEAKEHHLRHIELAKDKIISEKDLHLSEIEYNNPIGLRLKAMR